MTELTFKHLDDATDQYELFLFDLWGVVVENEKTYPGVVEAINKLIKKKDVMFLTNAPRPNFVVAEKLRTWGLNDVTTEMVLTSGDIARQIISNKVAKLKKTPVIYHLGADRNEDIFINYEHQITDNLDNADILLLSLYRDDDEDIHEFNDFLEEAAKKPNLTIICANPDTTIPKHGAWRYCAGYFAGIIEKFGGDVIYTGKPKAVTYNEIFRLRPNVAKDKILMIGDTLETDILGASSANIHSAIVLTGNSVRFHKDFATMDGKLAAIAKRAKEVKIPSPTFVTQIV